jgi:hypothetical protein
VTSLSIRGANADVPLPPSLLPRHEGSTSDQTSAAEPLAARGGIPGHLVQICRTSIIQAALPYGAVRVDAAGAGLPNRTRDGGLSAPLEVRVEYARARARQIRQARISCRINADGVVVALR